MGCNDICSSIGSGTTKLVKNAAFPALYVTLGHLPRIENGIQSLQSFAVSHLTALKTGLYNFAWSDIENINLKQIIGPAKYAFNQAGNALTLENAQWAASATWTGLTELFSEESRTMFKETFSKCHLFIGTAAAIGASATVLDALFKRTIFKHLNPYARVGISLVCANAITFAVAQYALGDKISPQILIDIALKVVVIGVPAKLVTMGTSGTFRFIRSSSDWFSWGVRKVCDVFIGASNVAAWPSRPTRLAIQQHAPRSDEGEAPPLRSASQTSTIKPSNRSLRTPSRQPGGPPAEEDGATIRAQSPAQPRRTPSKQQPQPATQAGGPPPEEDGVQSPAKGVTTPVKATSGPPPEVDAKSPPKAAATPAKASSGAPPEGGPQPEVDGAAGAQKREPLVAGPQAPPEEAPAPAPGKGDPATAGSAPSTNSGSSCAIQ